jgi:hypothetical protein
MIFYESDIKKIMLNIALIPRTLDPLHFHYEGISFKVLLSLSTFGHF